MSDVNDSFETFRRLVCTGFRPNYMETTLGDLRKLASDDPADHVKKFLAETEGVPDKAVIALTADSVTLLTRNDHLLEFA